MTVFNGPSGADSFSGADVDTVSFAFRLDATFSPVGNHLIVDTHKTHLTPTRVGSFHAVRQVRPRE